MSNFSILFFCRMPSACSREVPTGAVIKLSFVITSTIGLLSTFSKRKSRLVTMPFNMPLSSTIGIPPILCSAIFCLASKTFAVKGKVTGSVIIPLSARLTFLTSFACSAIDMFLCNTPIPPSRAIAIAIALSVTVSIAADTIGILIVMFRVNFV